MHSQRRLPTIDDVRWLLYASASADGRKFAVADERLRQQRVRWWVYQANDLLHFSYEALLKFALDTLAAHPMGLTLGALIGECVAAIREEAPSWPKTWEEFCRMTQPAENATTELENGERYLSSFDGMSARAEVKCTAECAWAGLQLLTIVDQRSALDLAAIERELGGLDREYFHSLLTERSFLDGLQGEEFGVAVRGGRLV